MKKLTDSQIEFVAVIEKSISKLPKLRDNAKQLQFYILERELIQIENELRDALKMQLRALRDGSLVDPLAVR